MTRRIDFNILKKNATVWARWPSRLVSNWAISLDGLQKSVAPDLYGVLEIKRTATQKEIRRAYRTLAKSLHPDSGNTGETGEEQFKNVSAAYRVLGDPNKRAKYDQLRLAGKKSVFGLSHRAVIVSFALFTSLTAGIATALLSFDGFERSQPVSVRITSPTSIPPALEEPRGGALASSRAHKAPEADSAVVRNPQHEDIQSVPPPDPHILSELSVTDGEDDMAWIGAEEKGTRAALNTYLRDYPGGRHALPAKNRLAFVAAVEKELAEDDASWAISEQQNSLEYYTAYLRSHPHGRHVGKAFRRLLEQAAAMRTSSIVSTISGKRKSLIPESLPLINPSGRQWPSAYQPFVEPEIGRR